MKRKILCMLLVLVLAISMIPAATAGENPDTGAKVEPHVSWGEYPYFHRYVALGQDITINLYYDITKSWGSPMWKLYKTSLTGSETEAELAEIGEKLVRKGKSAIDSGGGWVYNSSVTLHVDETFDADELGVGTYLMVGYVAYENQKNHSVTNDYETLCAIAIHVLAKEQPITSVKYYLCKEDGTTIRELTKGEKLTVLMANTGNDLEPSYIRMETSPANATEYVVDLHSVHPDGYDLTYFWNIDENFYGLGGSNCGESTLSLRLRDFADDSEIREEKAVFSVTVPHAQDGEVKTLIRPTCTESGLRGAWCESHYRGCNYVFEEKILAPYGHGLKEQGKQIVTEPTATKPGLAVGICATCGISNAEQPIPAIFSDVKPDDFYSDALDHGYDSGWVTGLTATTFGPGTVCNRAQVVTFLWRAAGCPEPVVTENPFVDVEPGSFYEKAVLWAVEMGITTGTDESHFSPNMACNRATVVTFLYRAFEEPAVEGAENPFTDVPADSWYTAPVLWAVEQGITNGMGEGIFGSETACNRAQIVTFLYRAYTE